MRDTVTRRWIRLGNRGRNQCRRQPVDCYTKTHGTTSVHTISPEIVERQSPPTKTRPTTMPTPQKMMARARLTRMQRRRRVVTAGGFYFSPQDLAIEPGTTVVWKVGGSHNANGTTNTLTGESFGNPEDFFFSPVSSSGEAVCIGSFTFTIPGVYSYDCSVGTHAALGMVGTVTVGTVVAPTRQHRTTTKQLISMMVHAWR